MVLGVGQSEGEGVAELDQGWGDGLFVGGRGGFGQGPEDLVGLVGRQHAEAFPSLHPRPRRFERLFLEPEQVGPLGSVGGSDVGHGLIQITDLSPWAFGAEVLLDADGGGFDVRGFDAQVPELGDVVAQHLGRAADGIDGVFGQLGFVEPKPLDAVSEGVEVLLDLLHRRLRLADLLQALLKGARQLVVGLGLARTGEAKEPALDFAEAPGEGGEVVLDGIGDVVVLAVEVEAHEFLEERADPRPAGGPMSSSPAGKIVARLKGRSLSKRSRTPASRTEVISSSPSAWIRSWLFRSSPATHALTTFGV